LKAKIIHYIILDYTIPGASVEIETDEEKELVREFALTARTLKV
jgi:hypothetical protein